MCPSSAITSWSTGISGPRSARCWVAMARTSATRSVMDSVVIGVGRLLGVAGVTIVMLSRRRYAARPDVRSTVASDATGVVREPRRTAGAVEVREQGEDHPTARVEGLTRLAGGERLGQRGQHVVRRVVGA